MASRDPRTHIGPYTCLWCGAERVTRDMMRDHIREHGGPHPRIGRDYEPLSWEKARQARATKVADFELQMSSKDLEEMVGVDDFLFLCSEARG